MNNATQILKQVKKDAVKYIHLQFTDILGVPKDIVIPTRQLENALEKGIWFDGSSIEGFARIAESDQLLIPDIKTYCTLPWSKTENKAARIICDVHKPDSTPFEGDPRHILRKMMLTAKDKGYIFNVGAELEFFILNKKEGLKPMPHDYQGYFDFSPYDVASKIRENVIEAGEELNIDIEAGHHEVAAGQHEIDFRYSDALKTADNIITLKTTIKAIAQSFDVKATFMPKPFENINGSGMHVHLSLFDLKGENSFYDENDNYKLSSTAKHFIGGILKHSKSFTALTNPTTNSYKRIVPGYEAPVNICWAQMNRSALVRIPRYTEGRKQSVRVELRSPDPSCNPYLAFTAILAAGLDGIESKITPPKSVEEDIYNLDEGKLQELKIDSLPGSLTESIKHLKNDEVIKKAIGSHVVDRFVNAKKIEIEEQKTEVTPNELKRYLDI
ncbi:glutamine synthetase family protein [Patescibacteria group bacterium]|nr:glutamine synthetase family protein [Patescibacteria group bacterium]